MNIKSFKRTQEEACHSFVADIWNKSVNFMALGIYNKF